MSAPTAMGSDNRQRPRILTVRLYDHEDDALQREADDNGVTRADMARHRLFGTPLAARPVPCGDAHGINCTPHHRDLVDGYRDQRYRDELALEAETGNYPGDIELRAAQGGRPLTTFESWLRTHIGGYGGPA